MAGADMRTVWIPTAANFFARVRTDTLDAVMLDLTGCNPQGSGFNAWKAQKKGEKAAAMERRFTDASCHAAFMKAPLSRFAHLWMPPFVQAVLSGMGA